MVKRSGTVSNTNEQERILEALREKIALHLLPPGSKLREKELAAEHNVSRARIRDAFHALEQRGLIERIPNRGAVVVRLDADEVVQLYDIREMLEALATRLAAQNSTPETWKKFIEMFGEPLDRSIEAEDFDSYMNALKLLNQAILRQANNRILADFLDHISDRTQIYARRVILLPGRASVGIQLHRKLLDALSKGQADEAERIKREIISGAKSNLLRYKQYIL